MSPRIADAEYLKDYTVKILFKNGEEKICNLEFLIKRFGKIKNKNLFRQFSIDSGGIGISWNDDIDISENELYKVGKKNE